MSLSMEILQSDETILVIALKGRIDTLGVPAVETKFHALLNNQNSPVFLTSLK